MKKMTREEYETRHEYNTEFNNTDDRDRQQKFNQ